MTAVSDLEGPPTGRPFLWELHTLSAHRAYRVQFCLPTAAKVVSNGPDWIHEIKYDGHRLRVERHGKTLRLFTRNGHDWTERFPWIVQAALKNRE